ncbi:MAG TPA: hypothetical protein VFH68_10350 [Polyangia bacterium]|jgi:hypothetical protein|nr:hypothetical protein [Polyangia bacterium]
MAVDIVRVLDVGLDGADDARVVDWSASRRESSLPSRDLGRVGHRRFGEARRAQMGADARACALMSALTRARACRS